MNPVVLVWCLSFAVLFAIACGGETSPTPTQAPTLQVTVAPTTDVGATVSAAIAATAEARPTDTSVPTATPTPVIAYQDNFNDPQSGWEQLLFQDAEFGYIGGEYRMLVKATGILMRADAPSTEAPSFSDFDLQVRARYQGAALNKSYGLNFRFEDGDNFYSFRISPIIGGYIFQKRERGTSVTIIDGTISPHINLGTTPNVLRVIARGSKFELYANGQLLDTAVDQTFSGGRIGLMASTGTTQTEQRFSSMI